jgi:Flp pilus assembly protein TadG
MMRRAFMRLKRDQTGATIVEFALILPALMVVLFGLFDLSYNMYVAQMLQGAIQDAARDSTIEGAASIDDTIDVNVTRAVNAVVPGVTPTFARKSYRDFTGVNRPEDYDDVNANDTCDNGEPFEDANFNGSWDLDPGTAGFGGARDATLYTVTVTYKRAFPIYALIPGQSENLTLIANTVLRNQPYGANMRPPIITRACV